MDPKSLSVDDLYRWIEMVRVRSALNGDVRPGYAIKSLLRRKVREAVRLAELDGGVGYDEYEIATGYRERAESFIDKIVAQVMGEEV